MKYYVIINGNSSLNIQGLAIESLPNISKPLIRTTREEIDGRDGDIITKLGYSAYDKTLNIGLWGNYDINEVIAYFNEDGVITFSNEPDKYYKFHILNRIDFVNQLEKFKKASITIHCQPFKYKEQEAKVIEEEEHTTSGTSFNLSDTLEAPLLIVPKGNTSQTGTPTPSSPIPVNVVSGDNQIVVSFKNIFYSTIRNGIITNTIIVDNNTRLCTKDFIAVNSNTTYTISYETAVNINQINISFFNQNDFPRAWETGWQDFTSSGNKMSYTFTTGANTKYIGFTFRRNDSTNESPSDITNLQLELGNQATTYELPTTYNIDLPVENLFDKDNANTLNAYIDSSGKIISENSNKMIYISCKSNTTYTIQKIVSTRFRVATYNTIPQIDSTSSNYVSNMTGASITITSGANDKYLAVWVYNATTDTSITYQQILDSIQIEQGNKANTYTPYGTTPIELNKIGTYQDYFYKQDDKWYLHKEVGKVVLDGSENWTRLQANIFYTPLDAITISTNINCISNTFLGIKQIDRISYSTPVCYTDFSPSDTFLLLRNTPDDDLSTFKTWLSTHITTTYYLLGTPTNTEITYTPLIEQLNTLEEAQSKEGTTNINQVNNDLPFIIDLTYYTGDTSITITNDGNIYSKPLLELKGTGNINIYLNGIQVFVVSLNNEIIYIDTDKMEAYYQGTLKNRQVVGDYNNFNLQSGNNTIQVDGGYVEYLKITNYSRWV